MYRRLGPIPAVERVTIAITGCLALLVIIVTAARAVGADEAVDAVPVVVSTGSDIWRDIWAVIGPVLATTLSIGLIWLRELVKASRARVTERAGEKENLHARLSALETATGAPPGTPPQ